MNSNKFSYQGHIETILHYLNSMIQKNWTGKTADEFNRLISIPELAKMACMSVRNLQLMFKAYTSETLHQYIIRNHTIFRHDNFIGCLSADKIKMPVRKYFCFNIPVYRNMAEAPSCRSPYHKEYIQTSVSGSPEGLCHLTYNSLSKRR